MHSTTSNRTWLMAITVVAMVLGLTNSGNCLLAAEPRDVVEARNKAYAEFLESVRKTYEKAKQSADVVAEVRVLTVVCTAARKDKDGKLKSVTLQIAMQVLAVEKGNVKKNEIAVVSRDVETPQILTGKPGYIPGPPKTVDLLNGKNGYPNIGFDRHFPMAPGVKGHVALRWDEGSRSHVPIAGWVTETSTSDIPVEVGKAFSLKDEAMPKQ